MIRLQKTINKIYGPFSEVKKSADNETRGKRSFFNGSMHRFHHLKNVKRDVSGQPRFKDGGRYVQETQIDFLKNTILVFDEIHTAHPAMLEFLRDCFKDSLRKSQDESVRCVFATATPFEKGEKSIILFLQLLLFDHPNL